MVLGQLFYVFASNIAGQPVGAAEGVYLQDPSAWAGQLGKVVVPVATESTRYPLELHLEAEREAAASYEQGLRDGMAMASELIGERIAEALERP